jgi:hypothetical protein
MSGFVILMESEVNNANNRIIDRRAVCVKAELIIMRQFRNLSEPICVLYIAAAAGSGSELYRLRAVFYGRSGSFSCPHSLFDTCYADICIKI